jgi:hypothetical protein
MDVPTPRTRIDADRHWNRFCDQFERWRCAKRNASTFEDWRRAEERLQEVLEVMKKYAKLHAPTYRILPLN